MQCIFEEPSTWRKSMTGSAKVALICCLLQGTLCKPWDVTMPQRVEALRGSCVMIPCTFTLPPDLDRHLDGSCKAIWTRGSWFGKQVFDSSLTGRRAYLNVLQGNLWGILHQKNCTTVFNNLQSIHNKNYYFRLECGNALQYSFDRRVFIRIRDWQPKPTVAASRQEVKEGAPVRLTCSTLANCLILPPALTWSPGIGHIEEIIGTESVTSVMTFNASHLHNGQKFLCTVDYKRQTGDNVIVDQSLTLRVLYPPNNTSVSDSGPVKEGSFVTLTCNAHANPAVYIYTWYKGGRDQATVVGFGRTLSIKASEADSRFYCKVSNIYGDQMSAIAQIDVRFSPKETRVLITPDGPALEGSSVTLVCQCRANPPVTRYIWYKDEEEDEETGGTLLIEYVSLRHGGGYRCTVRNEIGESFSATAQLHILYPPKNTSVSGDPSGPVPDGASVTLTCTSVASPAVIRFAWFRVAGGEEEKVGSERDLNVNATKLSEDQYYCEALNVHGEDRSEPASLNVIFAPEILPSSRCDKTLSRFQCSCDSQGNPPPSLMWEWSGKPVNHSSDILIEEVPLGSLGMRSLITLERVDEDTLSLVCRSINSLGSDSITFNMSSSEGLQSTSVLIVSVVGVLVMVLVLLMLIFYRKRKSSLSPSTGFVDSSLANENNSSQADVIYINKAILEQEVGTDEEDSLHYATVDFARLQAKSKGEVSGGEVRGGDVRGLASQTEEYAQIRLH